MNLHRIGGKIVSEEKLFSAISDILVDRVAGATQEEVAREHHVQRSFVSFLETLGELRRGARIALIAFPVSNSEEIRALGDKYSLDLVLALSQKQREAVEAQTGDEVFNMLLDTIAELLDYDTVIICASDRRIPLIKKVLGIDVIGIPIGVSPIREDVEVDLVELESIISGLTASAARGPSASDEHAEVVPDRRRRGPGSRGRMGSALGHAADLMRKWER